MTSDDELSISILKTFAQVRLGPATRQLPTTAELRAVLATAFGGNDLISATEGELARSALDVLRQDPALAELIQMTSIQIKSMASPRRYFEPATITLVAAAILALQTRVKFKLDHNHKWSIEFDKGSLSDGALKLLVERLLLFLEK
jgi:hypothetical protein